jgi:hypothetical protein
MKILATLIIVFGVTATVHAQPLDARATQAARGLGALPDLINAANYKTMGFDSVAEVASAKLGDAIPVFMVRLDQLRRYTGEDGSRLLVDLQTFVYPVHVAGQVRTAVEVRLVNGTWETARIGGAQRIRAIDKHRKAVMKSTRMAMSDFFEVRIPAVRLTFLGHHDAAGLKLTPLSDEPSLRLVAGTPEAAEQILARLVPLAQATPDNTP